MADNVPITAGSGTNVATDQLAGGEHVQLVKLVDGTADSGARVPGDATNGLDVDVTRHSPNPSTTGVIDDVGESVEVVLGRGEGAAAVRAIGTFVGTLAFEASVDGTNYDVQINAYSIDSQTIGPTTTVGGTFMVPVAGLAKFRVRAQSWTSGSVDVTVSGCVGAAPVIVAGALPQGTNTIGVVQAVQATASLLNAQTEGQAAHDAAVSGNPVLEGGRASAAAPADVSADGDAVRAWNLRNGARACVVTAAGALIGGDATNGLDVDVTRALVQGDVAHDAADAGNPVKQGAKAIAHGSNPSAVAAADRVDLLANRHGIPFVIGGHPNINTVRLNWTTTQADVAVVTVGAGLKIVVTRVSVTMDNANTVDVSAVLGFGAATVPATAGVVAAHPGIPPGGGMTIGDGSGILGIGADGEDLRLDAEAPTSGSGDLVVSYYTIES